MQTKRHNRPNGILVLEGHGSPNPPPQISTTGLCELVKYKASKATIRPGSDDKGDEKLGELVVSHDKREYYCVDQSHDYHSEEHDGKHQPGVQVLGDLLLR